MITEQLKYKESGSTTIICGPKHEDIALRAYFIWEWAGKPQAREHEFWSQAEAELRSESQKLNETICATLVIPEPEPKALRGSSPLKLAKTKKRF